MTRQSVNRVIAVTETRQRQSAAARILGCVCVLLVVASVARAQDQLPAPPLPVDLTPLASLLTAAEKAQLNESRNPKKVVEVYLKISDAHLDAALAAAKGSDAIKAERELDIYNKAMAEAAKQAFGLNDGKRGTSKKIEQALYHQLRILESVERAFPEDRVQFAEAAIKKAKQLRVQALNEAFAGGDVLKDADGDKPPTSNSPNNDGAHESSKPPISIFLRNSFWQRASQSAYLVSVSKASRQIPGDYLTEEEDNHVREAQRPDDRIKAFMKIADRRLMALAGDSPAATDAKAQKKLDEEKREWGELPKLPRVELLRHYARAVEECMAKLEDAYERNPKSAAIPKAFVLLRDATDKHLQILRTLSANTKDDKETRAILDAIEEAETANKGAREGLKGK
jgi:hypothetical protein